MLKRSETDSSPTAPTRGGASTRNGCKIRPRTNSSLLWKKHVFHPVIKRCLHGNCTRRGHKIRPRANSFPLWRKKTCFLSNYRCLVEHCDHLNGESAKGGDIKHDPVPIISFKKNRSKYIINIIDNYNKMNIINITKTSLMVPFRIKYAEYNRAKSVFKI